MQKYIHRFKHMHFNWSCFVDMHTDVAEGPHAKNTVLFNYGSGVNIIVINNDNINNDSMIYNLSSVILLLRVQLPSIVTCKGVRCLDLIELYS